MSEIANNKRKFNRENILHHLDSHSQQIQFDNYFKSTKCKVR